MDHTLPKHLIAMMHLDVCGLWGDRRFNVPIMCVSMYVQSTLFSPRHFPIDYRKVLELEPGNDYAQQAVQQLPRRIEEAQTREKDELLSQLKSVGNKLLGKFGLSTDNFKMQRNPESGGYSINFQR
jgi:hypothetical protein